MRLQERSLPIIIWILTIFATLTMGLAGLSKFTNPSQWHGRFLIWGYPAWFAPVIGGLEVLGAVLLLVPRMALYARWWQSCWGRSTPCSLDQTTSLGKRRSCS